MPDWSGGEGQPRSNIAKRERAQRDIKVSFAQLDVKDAEICTRTCCKSRKETRRLLGHPAYRDPSCKSRPASCSKFILSDICQLGNYLGALKNWVRLQNELSSDDSIYFSIVGLHAITLPQDAVQLRRESRDMLAALLAVGLDPQRCTIFRQEQVWEHAELAWHLNCIAPFGRLQRMTTWKVCCVWMWCLALSLRCSIVTPSHPEKRKLRKRGGRVHAASRAVCISSTPSSRRTAL